MPGFQQKIIKHVRRQGKTHSEETKQSLEPELDMTQMLELSDRSFKITMINRLRALRQTVDNTGEQIHNISSETETLREYKKEMLEVKNKVTERKTVW